MSAKILQNKCKMKFNGSMTFFLHLFNKNLFMSIYYTIINFFV
jgi:hypothetical protein